jgi:transcriptional regulator with XRE-family HTH domain
LSSLYPEFYQRLIDLLIEARKGAGITQVELGRRLGKRQTFVSKFELGERRLDAAEFVSICEAISVEASVLIEKARAG